MADAVSYELREGGVAWLTINRPEARNAINTAVAEGLWAGIRRFDADGGAKVLVLTGAGEEAFCAGADLKELAARGVRVPPRDLAPMLGDNVEVAKPVIAAVNGAAYGGGFALAQMCDLVVASETARFAITEARWGRGCPWAAPLAWLIPPRVALELALTATPISARRAYEVGLVNEVVPPAALKERAQALAATIAANAPLSVRAAKAMVYATAGRALRDALDEGWRRFEPVYLSEDALEGPRAFLERRPPRWQGR